MESILTAKSNIISLVGMSNVGKSHWAKRLEAMGLMRVSCDDLIARDLLDLLERDGYSKSIEDVAKWMGLPHEDRSTRNQRRYLEMEDLAVWEALESFGSQHGVIDTTGSVVHLRDTTRRTLQHKTTVVYLETPQHMQAEMLRRFIAEPKPVVFGQFWQPKPDESPEQTLSRCYSALLIWRSGMYEQMADVTIPYMTHRASGFTPEVFLKYVQAEVARA